MLKLVFALCFAACMGQHPAPTVPVTVYYESLCPDSIKFYTSQLFPAYTSPLKKYFTLKLVPFGKATYKRLDETNYEFTCHHGPNECYGNKIQGCALVHVPDEKDQVSLINCLMAEALGNKNNTYPIDKCASSTKIDIGGVVHCANNTEGSEVLLGHGSETEKLLPSLKSVPTIVFSSNYNKKDSDLAQTNFKAALCGYIQDRSHVHECHGVNSATSLSSVSTVVVLVLSFIFAFKWV